MGGMSDDTRENVGLHCRLKVESAAKYHADDQDTTKAPTQLRRRKKEEERREAWAVDRGRHEKIPRGHRRGHKGSAEEGLTYVLGSTRREERIVGRR